MSKRIGYIGGYTHGRIVFENGLKEERWFSRELWFDQDIDGRWLVGVADPDDSENTRMGALVVKDEGVAAFIELLAELIVEPEKFADEPVLTGPAWHRHWPKR